MYTNIFCSETLYVELAKKFQNEEKISAVDVDLVISIKSF